jgi:hypothetical protein
VIRGSPGTFIDHVNRISGTNLPTQCDWEPAFEVCFYRDLRHLRGKTVDVISQKRTFDLCFFSDDVILIIEAKAQQPFDLGQLPLFKADKLEVHKETGVANVVVLGLASSKYSPSPAVMETFDGKMLTWRDLSSLYSDDPILLRADTLYEPQQNGEWGKNNDGGYMTGDELLAAYNRGEQIFVGRGGGIYGPRLAQDVRTGSWREQKYETSRTASLPKPNWFELADFVKLISGMK